MRSRNEFTKAKWKGVLAVVSVAAPLAALGTGSAVSAGTMSTHPHLSYECDDSLEPELVAPYIVADVPEGDYGKPLSTGEVTTAQGSPAEVLLFRGDVKQAYLGGYELTLLDSYKNVDQGDTVYFEVLQGMYTVVFDFPPGYKELLTAADVTVAAPGGVKGPPPWAGSPGRVDDVIETIFVNCSHGGGGGGGGYNFNFSIVTTTTPPLPKTGGDSNSMLALAPALVLLGGALILVRRRVIA